MWLLLLYRNFEFILGLENLLSIRDDVGRASGFEGTVNIFYGWFMTNLLYHFSLYCLQ